MLLQVAFLGALSPHNLSHGWSKLSFEGLAGPFAGLASAVGLAWLATLLYVDAAVSPGGTGLIYTATSSRLSYALSRNGYVLSPFSWISERGVPVVSIGLTFVVGVILFLPFPGWQTLVGFITSATVMSYALAPLALGALRRQDPRRNRPFRLPLAPVLAPAGFVVANLIVYWSGWTVDRKLFVAIGIGFLVLGTNRLAGERDRVPPLDLRAAAWLWPYLGGMAVVSWLGQYDGRRVIPFWWDLLVVSALSLAVYQLAQRMRLPAERAREYVAQLSDEDEAERAELSAH